MNRNEKSLQALFSGKRIIKSSREQKAISKFLDKNGNLVNFDRWSYNKYNSILRKTVDSCAENLALYKDDLKKMDKFVIYETEPNGNIINTLYECSRSEFLDMVRKHYKEYTGNYPDEDKFDFERWSYINSSRRPIKSGYDDEFTLDVGEFGQGGTITVTKIDNKWVGSDGKQFMGYLTPEEIVEWYEKDYGSAWLNSSRRPIKSSNNDLFNQIKDYIEGETAGKGVIRTRGNNLYFRSLIITVFKDGYIMRDDTHDKHFDGDTFEEFKDDYWKWVNPF